MIKDIPGLIEEVKKELKEFTDVAVIGLSGGADSTLVTILCQLALGQKNVFAVHMPASDVDKTTFNSLSVKISEHLKLNNAYLNLTSIVDNFKKELSIYDDKALGNIKARCRMTALYAVCEMLSLSHSNKRIRVIGTDNLSEHFIGYYTKYGDGGVDINPIETLFKSEVYQLLDYFKDQGVINEEHINRVPSAGLWLGQTDEGELGFTYAEMEECIKNYADSRQLMVEVEPLDTPCYKFISEMHKKNKHKDDVPPALRLRDFCDWEYF